MTDLTRSITHWQLRTRRLELGARTLVMGVVNITPDSFSDGGAFLDAEAAVAQGLRLLDEGADILDLGAESTRPGARVGGVAGLAKADPLRQAQGRLSTSSAAADSAQDDTPVIDQATSPHKLEPAVSAEEEQARLLPVLKGILRARPEAIVSVDSYKAATARAALGAGAEIVNDVSGFAWDAEMAAVCAETRAGVVLMHTRGRPDEWRTQAQLDLDELLEMVRVGLAKSMTVAAGAGVANDALVLDPGYGFGKRFGENYSLLARQSELLALGRPLLAGVSRKSFLGYTLAPLFGGKQAPVEARETASVAAMVTAILHGASMVRVHAVRAAVEAARVADAVLAAG